MIKQTYYDQANRTWRIVCILLVPYHCGRQACFWVKLHIRGPIKRISRQYLNQIAMYGRRQTRIPRYIFLVPLRMSIVSTRSERSIYFYQRQNPLPNSIFKRNRGVLAALPQQ
jgi:hypothetical protein